MTKIYLLSPEKIELSNFSKQLEKVLKTNLIPVFQLRLKNIDKSFVKKSAFEIKKICHDNNCLFILNDDYNLAQELESDGVHLGQDDFNIDDIENIRNNSSQNFIIGSSCYDSRDLALNSVEAGVDYISFGTFFKSKTKNSRGKPEPEIISWANEMFDVQNCAIGGINYDNCDELVKNKADFLAIISYIWQNEKGLEYAVKSLNDKILLLNS